MKRNKLRYINIILAFIILAVSSSFSQTPGLKNAIYYNKQGWENLAKGDHFRAILSFKNALKQNPKYKDALLGLGKAYLKTEAYEESLKLFSDVLRIDRGNTDAIDSAASAMAELGRFDDALKYLDKSLEINEDNTNAKYGIAYIYYLMDKLIWSKRKANDILKINPYHYEALLLMADIKVREKRDEEAKSFIQKAIDSDVERPDAYVKIGQVLLRDYKITQNPEYMSDAVEKFKRALAINPENLLANRSMGNLFLIQKNYEEALKYFTKSAADYPDNSISLYNIAITYAGMNDNKNTVDYLMKAMRLAPSDNLLIAKLEDFLVLNDFAIGHPLRVEFSENYYDAALKKFRTNLPKDAVMYLRRALILNPLNRQARESLRDVYNVLNYYRLYLNEQKNLYDLFPENKYQDMLRLSVIKRRERIYHRAGYSSEFPPRDVPKVLVLNFSPVEPFSLHPDAGVTIANYLTVALSEYGRMQPVGLKRRMEICSRLKNNNHFIADNLEIINDMIREGITEKPDFIITGNFREGFNYLSLNFEMLNFHNGVIINNFSVSENGKENLPNLAVRVSNRLYDNIPFKGRVLQVNNDELIVNLGLIDGIKPGDYLSVYKLQNPESNDLQLKKKITLEIKEADTMISSAKVKNEKEIEYIDINDSVYPYEKRRAKLLD
ncbi:MAG: tetratricopeptide repeat protein [Spirochaetes bacterium]|nr:tetratricopeptide repeat protein [Spirochaetota bacterium]